MSAGRWLRLALLLSLVPLALRAASLLLGVPALASSSSSSRQSWTTDPHERAAAAAVSVWPARDRDWERDRPYRHARHRRRRRAGSGSAASSSDDGARRRLRQAAGGDWFEDDKRLAPTGSNPLHNLR